jgi:hypothetical protein
MIGDSDEIAAVGFHKFIVVVVVVELWSSESPRPGDGDRSRNGGNAADFFNVISDRVIKSQGSLS